MKGMVPITNAGLPASCARVNEEGGGRSRNFYMGMKLSEIGWSYLVIGGSRDSTTLIELIIRRMGRFSFWKCLELLGMISSRVVDV